MAGRRLILVKHSVPEIRPDVPPAEWGLTEAGRARARDLAVRLPAPAATALFASTEPKARETAEILAATWDVPVRVLPDLREHERPEPGLLQREQFEGRIRELFARPADRVFGAESADSARKRFTMAVMRLLAANTGDVAVVAHGTVITLFVAEATGVEPFAFWQRLTLPSAVTLSVPDLRVETVVAID